MQTLTFLQLLIIVYCLYIALRRAWYGWRTFYLYRILPGIEPQVAGGVPCEPPAVAGTLEEMGFRRLGETQVCLPGRKQPVTSWILVDKTGAVQAEVPDVAAAVEFFTAFQDETIVETGFPEGEQFDTPTFRSRTITSSPARAYPYQLRQVEAWSRVHGAAHDAVTLSDYLHWEQVYRNRYLRRRMRRNLVLNGVLPQVLLILILGAVTYTLVTLPWHALNLDSASGPIRALFWFVAIADVLTEIRWRVFRWGRQRDAEGGAPAGGP